MPQRKSAWSLLVPLCKGQGVASHGCQAHAPASSVGWLQCFAEHGLACKILHELSPAAVEHIQREWVAAQPENGTQMSPRADGQVDALGRLVASFQSELASLKLLCGLRAAGRPYPAGAALAPVCTGQLGLTECLCRLSHSSSQPGPGGTRGAPGHCARSHSPLQAALLSRACLCRRP